MKESARRSPKCGSNLMFLSCNQQASKGRTRRVRHRRDSAGDLCLARWDGALSSDGRRPVAPWAVSEPRRNGKGTVETACQCAP